MKTRRASRGTSLVEALVALAVLAAGTLGLTRLQAEVQRSTELQAQHAQALQSAAHELEAWRSGVAVDAAPYRIERGATHDAQAPALTWTTVAVDWLDRRQQAHRLVLASASAGTPPELSGALVISRGAAPRVHGRAPAVPVLARDLGDGRSLVRPSAAMPIGFVVDNTSGQVVARCRDPGATDCDALDGWPLAGWIRVSLAAPPDPVHPDDTPLPVAVALQLTQGSLVAPGCATERRDGVLAYHCVIAPERGAWSGRTDVVVADANERYRVCRYVAPGSDRNATHPDRYELVDRPLMQQNFLVIRRDQACPVVPASPALPDGIATAAHAP
jgi:Tfp pilus assembly protein PilV